MASTRKLSTLFSSLLLALPALAQQQSQQQQALPTVTVSGRSADAPVTIGGFGGETPVAKLPLQASVLSAERLLDAGIDGLSGLTNFDASVGDAYNSQGYVSYLKVRGFDLDNRFNYRRDGLPINAETALALGNKSGIELLKGTSGIQSGTSAPGGLVNLLVKRPTAAPLTNLTLALSERGTAQAALDWSRRFGAGQVFGLRINAAAAELRPLLRDAKGDRRLLALAGDWRATSDTLVEAEFEWNRQSQPSQPGFSLLGSKLPSAKDIDPRINLNNQAWSQPVVFDNTHASLRLTQRLNADWKAQAHLGVQRLKTDDRLAYASGKYDPVSYDCAPCDRFAADGSFSIWDFRSENERRDSDALDLSLAGKFRTGPLRHELSTGLLLSRFESRFQRQAYNLVGVGTIDGKSRTPADPSLTDENTNRDERSTEFYLRDSVGLDALLPGLQGWLGLRHTQLKRESVRTDGSRATSYKQNFTTPWLGLSQALTPQLMAYASWGEGVESEVIPNRGRYNNPGQALPAQKSRQLEIGLKAGSSTVDWGIAAFDIKRPQWRDIGTCDANLSCTRAADGTARHRGLEAQADLKWSGGGLLASAMKLRARRHGSADASLNGLKPANVAETALKLQGRQDLIGGLQLQAGLVYEGPRAVLPDNSLKIPGWTRLDAGLRYEQQLGGGQQLTWRAGVDNLANRRAWKESPFQYGHAYLYPLEPRTWRISLETSL
ncbi:TonB-dependent siderophore receptor [Roseateles sp. DAIF2]|uniref:TonB-dependent siderophore receptor n=1 Tax=Roseateles sp. DAIF2 TaxID=2714952 RepID=UPI0018A277EB|nr:TonB-dependent siderophore receptor [Roseateles sp. DAIF2]QPF72812.1 TonB-dependent siderophore receptor [Roseateles sp. DAIF2]